MGQETTGKKELEKKRQKNKRDKEDKKAQRKLNNKKGQGLDAMMAYTDENGNILSAPPDPLRKKEISLDAIQLGAAKQMPIDPAELIRDGVVTFFNEAKGYGFITDLKSQANVFVHASQLSEALKEKDKVTFEIENGPKGATAVSVKKKK
jgi:cold shock CspA family protein